MFLALTWEHQGRLVWGCVPIFPGVTGALKSKFKGREYLPGMGNALGPYVWSLALKKKLKFKSLTMNYQTLTYSPIFALQDTLLVNSLSSSPFSGFTTVAGSLLHTQSSFCSQFIIPPLWKVRSKARSNQRYSSVSLDFSETPMS